MIIRGDLVHAGRLAAGWVEITANKISDIGWGSPVKRSQAAAGVITRGLVDLQVNGALGLEVTSGTEALSRISEFQLDHGVTSFLPTVITTDRGQMEATVEACRPFVRDESSPVAGVHLEGPFLNPEQAGVHRPELMRRPDADSAGLIDAEAVRLVTLAPELPGAIELCSELAAKGVLVSLGHTSADLNTASRAFGAGARMTTHLFNAMPPLHHRDPGIVGWALVQPRLNVGLIADGVHVHPLVLKMVAKLAGHRVVLVTDASVAAGAGPGSYRQGGVTIAREEDGRVVAEDGGLAGSSLTMDEAIRNWIDASGIRLEYALASATSRPAGLVGLNPGLVPGAPADLAILDPGTLEVRSVMKAGSWVREA